LTTFGSTLFHLFAPKNEERTEEYMKQLATFLINPFTDELGSMDRNGEGNIEKDAGSTEAGPGKLREETSKNALVAAERASNFRTEGELADILETECGFTAGTSPLLGPAPQMRRPS
jgi:hypothetical protein